MELTTSVLQQPWAFVKELGQGAYGYVSSPVSTLLTDRCVSAAQNTQTGETCAVKKVTNVFTKKVSDALTR